MKPAKHTQPSCAGQDAREHDEERAYSVADEPERVSQHRLTARVHQSIVAALLLLALAPSGAQAFSKAIWGPVYQNGVSQFPLYQKLGVKIVEMDLNWSTVAPTRPHNSANPNDPAYLWPAEVQQALAQAKTFGMQVLLQIIGAPRWSNGGHAWNWAPRPGAFATFAGAAARHYRTVHLWMIWGEPNRRPNFQPESPAQPGRLLNHAQQVAPHNYAGILDAAYGALKRVNRHNLVIGGATYTTGDIDTEQWIQNLRLPNGHPPRMDVYAHNPFTWRVPAFSNTPSPDGEVMFPDLKRLGGWIDRYLHRGLPIFMSEFTIPTAVDQEFDFYVDPPTQATWITDALRAARRWKRIYALGWIHVYDNPPASSGGLMTADGSPKPGFYAFEHG
ncbi:MAG TPA: hypothetical protein VG371_12640 [Solirubrobacteraceae bacterium]|nr:hypothetical protein [Solirubrobacteraceae bacterium]